MTNNFSSDSIIIIIISLIWGIVIALLFQKTCLTNSCVTVSIPNEENEKYPVLTNKGPIKFTRQYIPFIIILLIVIVCGFFLWYRSKPKDPEPQIEKKRSKKKKSLEEKYSPAPFVPVSKKDSYFELSDAAQQAAEPDFFASSENHCDGDSCSIKKKITKKSDQDPNVCAIKEQEERMNTQEGVEIRDVQSGNWENNYGLPLTTNAQKKAYAKKLAEENKKYVKAMSAIHDYVTDESTIIRPTLIDPFRHPELFKGEKINNLYDKMTANVKPAPKKVKEIKNGITTYDGDSENPMESGHYETANYGDAW